MISKYMRGRLGNQLFQYAAMRYIEEVNGNHDKLYFNFSKYVYSKGFEDELKYFKVKEYEEVKKVKVSISQLFYIFYFKTYKKLIHLLDQKNYYIKRHNLELKYAPLLIKKGIYWKEDGLLPITKTKAKNKIVIGHYEAKENFDQIREKLLKELEPKEAPLVKNKELYDIIESTNSVCISIRRGDFVENKEFSKTFNVCNEEYFKKAVEMMNQKLKNPTYIIFSDDIDWCKKNIVLGKNTYYEDGDDPVWEKLRLMYSCKHFIISNSSFSWWAQYLSRNKDKIVIAPSKWANSGYKDDIFDENWNLIDNK